MTRLLNVVRPSRPSPPARRPRKGAGPASASPRTARPEERERAASSGAARSGAAPASGSPAASAEETGDFVVVGEFGRAHGVRGEVRLKSSTADPAAIAGYGPFLLDDGRAVALDELRPVPGTADMFVARVAGVGDRTGAEALNRLRLRIPRDRLPPPDDEDEFYLADLIGLRVETQDGVAHGRIVALHDFGAGDILEIAPVRRGATVMAPFTKAFVPIIDIAAGRIVVADDPFAHAAEENEPDRQPQDGAAG